MTSERIDVARLANNTPKCEYSTSREHSSFREVSLMGTRVRPRPRNLSQKLHQIRIELALSRAEITRRLGFGDSLHVGRISEYERGLREPSLLVLLAYARLAGVHMEDLIDDDIDLPRLHRSLFYRRSGRNDGFCRG